MSRTKYEFTLYSATPMTNLREVINYAADQYADKPAFIFQESLEAEPEKISFTRYRQDIQEVACGLISALRIDVNRRDSKKIALLAPNSYWWSVCYLAVTTINHVIVPLDPNLPTQDLLSFMKRAGVSSIIFTPEINDKIAAMKSSLAKIKHYISLGEASQASITMEKIHQLGIKQLRKNARLYDDIAVYPDNMCTMLFTSGTTSTPKAVMLTHKNLASELAGMRQFNDFHDERLLSVLPLYHSYEFMVGLLFPIYCGCTIYYLPGGLHAFTDHLARVRPTVMVLVPLVIEESYRRVRAQLSDPDDAAALAQGLKDYYGGQLTRIIVGGAPINSDIAEIYDRSGIKLLQGYGISECSPVVCMNPDTYYKPRSVGMPLPNLRAQIDQPDEEGVGEIVVRGPTVMLGYYKDERQTDKVIIDNWLHTGDYGRFDEDGFLYVVGRKKNVIIGKNAKKVYPEEVEYHLTCRPEIREALVYGQMVDDDTKVAALLVVDEANLRQAHPELTAKPSAADIQKVIGEAVDAVNEANIKYKRVVNWQIVSALPRTATGKIKRTSV